MVDVAANEKAEGGGDDIRSALAAAFVESEKATEKPEVAKPAEKAKAADAADKGEPDKGRDASGKFVKGGEAKKAEAAAEAAAEDAEKPDTEAKGAEAKTEPEEKPAESKDKGREPPANWSAADKETFKSLPEPAQQILLQRHKAMEADYTKKTQAIAALKSEYEPIDQMLSPHRDAMKAKGFTPRTLIQAWANVETELASGADRAANIIKALVTGYRIPVEKVAGLLGIRGASAPAVDPAGKTEQPSADTAKPIEIHPALQAEINSLKARADAEDERRANEARAARIAAETGVQQEIETFKSASDKDGNLQHPHFAEVEDDMTALANAAIAKRQPVPSLDKLYETAVWANPSTREKLLAAQAQAAEKKRTDEARAKSAEARKAAASVTGAPGSAGAQAQRRANGADLSLREQLLEAAEESAA